MTGYLSRLAGRATTSTTIVRPRVPARFQAPDADLGPQVPMSSTADDRHGHQWPEAEARDHAPDVEAPAEASAQTAEPGATDARSTPQRPTGDQPSTDSDREPHRAPGRRAAAGPTTEAGQAGSADRTATPRQAQAPPAPQHPASEQPSTAATDPPTESRQAPARPAPQHPANDRVSVSEPTVVAAVPTPSQADLPFPDATPAQPAETVVSIHIGRVDVRTPSPSASRTAAPRQPRPTPDSSRLTLSQFLRGEREAR